MAEHTPEGNGATLTHTINDQDMLDADEVYNAAGNRIVRTWTMGDGDGSVDVIYIDSRDVKTAVNWHYMVHAWFWSQVVQCVLLGDAGVKLFRELFNDFQKGL